LRSVATSLDLPAVALFSMLRVVLAWPSATPDLFETMSSLGRESVLGRIDEALLRLGDEAIAHAHGGE
jgi:hypothetical protein